jgi:aspartate kinase
MRIVMKFGGTSVASGEKIRHVAELLKRYHQGGNEVIAVTSALGGVTDGLLSTANEVSISGKVTHVKEFIAEITKKHYDAIHAAVDDDALQDECIGAIDCSYLGELTPRSLDYISSYGERLAAPIVSVSLRSMGIMSRPFTGGEAGITTDSNYGDAKPLEQSYPQIYERLCPLLADSLPVVTGFIAWNQQEIITTLGRSGSDFSASIIGAAVKADEIWLWKEVDGIMTTDPKIVPEAQSIPRISYIEAMELSYFGAKVLHPRTIEPAIKHRIPVRVKNTFDPEFEGTLIVSEQKQKEDVVKAVTLIRKVALINISGAGMMGTIGTAARVFSSLAIEGVNIIMISQGSSESNMTLIVNEDHLETAVAAIRREFSNNVVGDVAYDRDVCVVAVVGAGMDGIPGVAGKVFNALGKAGINIIMISQGSSQHNISFVVSSEDVIEAVRVLHKEFELDRQCRD